MMFNNYYDPTSFASHTQLTQATGQIAYQVLRRACEDVRKAPARLPLWSLRIAQHDGQVADVGRGGRHAVGRPELLAAWAEVYEVVPVVGDV